MLLIAEYLPELCWLLGVIESTVCLSSSQSREKTDKTINTCTIPSAEIQINVSNSLQIHHPLNPDGSRSTRGQRVHLQLWDTAGQER